MAKTDSSAVKQTSLNTTLLEYRLKLNFPNHVENAVAEYVMWSGLGRESPDSVKNLYYKRVKLHTNKQLVNQCVMEVNNVLDSLQPVDVSLFKNRLSRLADAIKPLFENKGWENPNLNQIISKVRAEAVDNF